MNHRPDLTWRDIQYLCIATARKVNPKDPDWERTAAGHLYSYKYGYGALDAYAYVKAAQTWKLVKPQAWLHTETIQINGGKMYDLGHKKYKYVGGEPIGPGGVEGKITITKEMMVEHNLEALEHINVRVWISHTKRGDVEVEIISPNGVRSVLASTREFDESTTGFPGWRFMTIKHWYDSYLALLEWYSYYTIRGENPIGEWKLKIADQENPAHNGAFLGWNMALWGTAIDPSKAMKWEEPVIDNALPPSNSPPRPVPNDSDGASTTQLAKPTDLLPTDHGHATGENTRPSFPNATGKPKPQQDDTSGGWVDDVSDMVSSQKWSFAALGGLSLVIVGAIVYFWRRRLAQQRLANYSSLAADDIHMDAIGQNRVIAGSGGPRTTRALYDDFGQPSNEELPQQTSLNPPTARGLGFHSGFLDDDEPSAGLTPKYRDEPTGADPISDVRSVSTGSTPRESHDGSRERLA